MFLLDTNVVSELRKLKPHGAALKWFNSYPESAFYLPSIALYELQAGAEITTHQDSAKADELQRWIDSLEKTFPVLSLNALAARETARLMYGKSDDLYEDAMIVAIAKTNRLTVATRNLKDFTVFHVKVVNPFVHV